MHDAERLRAIGDRRRVAAGNPGDGDARQREHLDADAVERRERLHLLAVVAVVDPAIRQHAVDVTGQKTNLARTLRKHFGNGGGHHRISRRAASREIRIPQGGRRTQGRRPQDSRRLAPRSGVRRSRTK
jgi:hypothetical protein